jgi:hypothetical protein
MKIEMNLRDIKGVSPTKLDLFLAHPIVGVAAYLGMVGVASWILIEWLTS